MRMRLNQSGRCHLEWWLFWFFIRLHIRDCIVPIGILCDQNAVHTTCRPRTPCRADRRTTSKRLVMSRWSRNTETLGGGNPPAATHRTCGSGDPATNVRACRRRPTPPPPPTPPCPPSSASVSDVWTTTSVDDELFSLVMYNRLMGAVYKRHRPSASRQ